MNRLSSFSLIAVLALTACTRDSTPTDAVNSALLAAAKDDANEFRSLLSGSALSQYGSEEGFEAFRHSLQSLDPETSSETLLSNSNHQEVYSVLVNTSDESGVSILTAQVTCDSQKVRSCRIESIFFN